MVNRTVTNDSILPQADDKDIMICTKCGNTVKAVYETKKDILGTLGTMKRFYCTKCREYI